MRSKRYTLNCEEPEEVEGEVEEGEMMPGISIGSLLGGDSGWHPTQFVGLGPESRSIFLLGEIEEKMAGAIITQIQELTSLDPQQEIVVYIHSPGGCVSATLAIYDALRHSPCPVITVVVGQASSGACILTLAGDFRIAFPNAEFFWHEAITMVAIDSHEDFAKHLAHYKSIMKKIKRVVLDRTGMSKKQYKKYLAGNTNFTFSARKALKMNWIDRVEEYADKPRFKTLADLEAHLNDNEEK
jgi:ATP-dependent Clp protease protease subunit